MIKNLEGEVCCFSEEIIKETEEQKNKGEQWTIRYAFSLLVSSNEITCYLPDIGGLGGQYLSA